MTLRRLMGHRLTIKTERTDRFIPDLRMQLNRGRRLEGAEVRSALPGRKLLEITLDTAASQLPESGAAKTVGHYIAHPPSSYSVQRPSHAGGK